MDKTRSEAGTLQWKDLLPSQISAQCEAILSGPLTKCNKQLYAGTNHITRHPLSQRTLRICQVSVE